jgi:DNA mismatch repair protein MSH3
MAMPELVVQALALSVRYLKGFGMERIICFGSSFRPFSADAEFSLSANALQQLEVVFCSTFKVKVPVLIFIIILSQVCS